jgi:hypothetical protein
VSHRFRSFFALLMAVLLLLGVPAAAGAAGAPNGRHSYVVALMRNVGTESFVRLAQYTLRDDQTIRADFWAWNAQTLHPRTPTGYTTSGCANTCKVWTAEGFESGPSTMLGVWSVSGHNLSVTWDTTGEAERWVMTNYETVTRIELASHPRATDGFGWGSTRGFTTAANMTTIHSKPGWYQGPRVINNWGEVTTGTEALVIHPNDANYPNRLCNANCVNNSTVTNKIYLAGSGNDRKVYYNMQLFDVDGQPCIGGGSDNGAGHLKPSLQIIDDAGQFRGLVTVEASLYFKKFGSNILGIFDMNNIVPAS